MRKPTPRGGAHEVPQEGAPRGAPRRRPRPALHRRPFALALLALALLAASCSGETPTTSEPLRLLGTSLPQAVIDEPYQADLEPVGGLRPYTFTLEEGALPPGLSLQGGRLLGTPRELGSFEFAVAVSDANLASTFRRYTLRVEEVPVPTVTLATPDTEVRRPVTLRLRVSEARRFRAVRLRAEWDAERFTLDEGSVAASSGNVAVLHDASEGRLQVDAAVLGDPADGEVDVARFDLVPEDASTLRIDWEAELLYADRHHYAEGSEGRAPSPDGAAEPVDEEQDDVEPEDTEPEDTEPEDTEPEDTEPEDTRPEDTEPEDTEPEDTQQGDQEPEDGEDGP